MGERNPQAGQGLRAPFPGVCAHPLPVPIPPGVPLDTSPLQAPTASPKTMALLRVSLDPKQIHYRGTRGALTALGQTGS